MNKNTIIIIPIFFVYSHVHLNAENTFAQDAASFFKIEQAIEKKGLEETLKNKSSTKKAQIIIAAAQKLPSFIMAIAYPEIDSYWFAFEDALERLKIKYQAVWSQETFTKQLTRLISSKEQIKQKAFHENVEFQEVVTKVNLNFQLARKLALQRTQ